MKAVKHKHICIRPFQNNAATVGWIAKKIMPYVNDDQNISDKVVETLLDEQYRLDKPLQDENVESKNKGLRSSAKESYKSSQNI